MKSRNQKEERLPASMTVEASYVMALVIMALAILIKSAYGQCRRTTQIMKLHYAVEQVRSREDLEEKDLSWGRVFKNSAWAEGNARIEDWEKQIVIPLHQPEEILRMLTIFEESGGERP